MDIIKKRIFSLSLLLILVTAISIHVASWWLITTHHNDMMASKIQLADDFISQYFSGREKNIVLAAELITQDYGFREAVATEDTPTIQSMLENHSARIDADYFAITGNDGKLLASQKISTLEQPDTIFSHQISDSQKTTFMAVDNRLFRVVTLPVLAPRKIGHAVIGYQITPPILEQLKSKTRIDLHFYSQSAEKLLISTHPQRWEVHGKNTELTTDLSSDSQNYVRQTNIGLSQSSGPGDVALFLQPDISNFQKSQQQIHLQMLLITAIAVLLASLMSSSLAKRLADPLSALYKDLTHRANHDYLTGIANRHSAIKQISASISRISRTKQSYCVGICDIDNFKQINDQYGHTVGDQVLKQFAKRLSSAMREPDTLGRFGGEEFLIGIDVSADAAVEAFERLRQLIAEMPIQSDPSNLPVTMSCGVCLIDGPPDEIHIEQVVEKADAALYQAKRNGKNQISVIRLSQEI